MDIITREELKLLMDEHQQKCISIYIPTHRAGLEIQQDIIRYKNMLRKVEEVMMNEGIRSSEIRTLLEPAHALMENSLFWHYQSDGLAVFISPGLFRTYRLPLKFEEMCMVSQGFHLKRLLQLFTTDAQYYILGLSKKRVHLYRGTRDGISEFDADHVPPGLAEALQPEEYEKDVQFHSVPVASRGKANVVFHGHGGKEQETKTNLEQHFRKIDKALHEFMGDDNPPLLLVGVEYLQPIYRQVNTHQNLLSEGITGSPEGMSAEELHKRAWAIVCPHLLQKQQKDAERYQNMLASDRVSSDIRHILPAAIQGRVDVLFVSNGIRYWGLYNPVTMETILHKDYHPGDKDLLNEAAFYALLNKGTVYAVDPKTMPDDLPGAAIFRY